MSNPTLLTVDDSDPTLTYSTKWRNTIPPHTANRYHQGTLHHFLSNSSYGGNLLYSFTGTDILVTGRFIWDPSLGHQPLSDVQCMVDEKVQQVLPDEPIFCRAHNLSGEAHHLKLNIDPATGPLFQIAVDYIQYLPSSLTSIPHTSIDTVDTAVDAPKPTEKGHKHSQVLAIVGGVLAGVVFIFIALRLVRLWRRRQKTLEQGGIWQSLAQTEDVWSR